jgi:hypothetical protein
MTSVDDRARDTVIRVVDRTRRLGEQTAFYGNALAATPDAVRRYPAEVLRLIAGMGMGTGALAVIGGTAAINKALQAIPQDNLRTVVDEADKAVGGLGPELSRVVDGSTSLAIEAGKSVDQIGQLIDRSPPVLNSQLQIADSIASWAQRTAAITGPAQG